MKNYMKPRIVATETAATLIQFSINKPGSQTDGIDLSATSYRSDE